MAPSIAQRSFLSVLALIATTLAVRPAAANGSLLEKVATFRGAMPTGVTVAASGRIFVNFPQWGDRAPFAVAEVKKGKVVPFPNVALNRADPKRPAETFLSVQSVVADAKNRLWVLDTAAPGFQAPIAGGAKLVAIDLATNKVVRTLVLPDSAVLESTYLNDVRFDLRQGKEGVAYVTDSSTSGPGAILVVDLASGSATRRLSGHPSTAADPSFTPTIDGEPLKNRPAGGEEAPFRVAADGIALSSDGATLYYAALSSRRWYAAPTAALRDANVSDEQLAAQVKDLGVREGASDGLEADDQGRVFATDYENNAIRRWSAGTWATTIRDPRLSWPDTIAIGPDQYLYVIANQLHRQPGFHGGKDLRKKPYELLRVKVGSGPVLLK